MNSMQDLVSLIRKEISDEDILIEEYSLLEEDLGITGEDAYDLIISFSKTFNVNIDNFSFSKYFNEEPSPFLTMPYTLRPFRVRDLLKAIESGKLDDDTFNY